MAYEIRITGEITSSEYDDWYGFNLSQLNSHLDFADGKDLLIDINSQGGCLVSGMAIYAAIKRYAKKHNAHVTTRTSGFVASSATVIFLSGDTRIVNEFLQPFIHEPRYFWSEAETSKQYKKEGDDLEVFRNSLANFYAKTTDMTVEEASELMANDTWMTAEQCLANGFATEIEKLTEASLKIVASLSNKINKNKIQMSKPKFNLSKVLGFLAKRASAKLELADVAGTAVVFPDLEDGDKPKENDAVVFGEDANYSGVIETEQYVMDVTDGSVDSVIDKDEVDESEIIEELVSIIEEKEEEIKKLEGKLKAYAIAAPKNKERETSPQNKKNKNNEDGKDEAKATSAKLLDRLKNKGK